jgi:hypothetical protein
MKTTVIAFRHNLPVMSRFSSIIPSLKEEVTDYPSVYGFFLYVYSFGVDDVIAQSVIDCYSCDRQFFMDLLLTCNIRFRGMENSSVSVSCSKKGLRSFLIGCMKAYHPGFSSSYYTRLLPSEISVPITQLIRRES